MKLNSDNTAETVWEDDNGSEWQVRISFDYHAFEKQEPDCPEQPAHIEITNIERKEQVNLDVYDWVAWNDESDSELLNWECDIMEAINQQVDDRGNEP